MDERRAHEAHRYRLIVLGVLALALGGFNYTTRERVVDLGPLKVDADKHHSLPIAPIAGVAALVGGIVR